MPAGDSRLDAPLPWDHVDTGISRGWLKADLQKALEAVTVPDCSHSVCSECGVCGEEFGENVVVEPPPVPAFDGTFNPTTTKAQRLRLRFTKRADLVFVGHLDVMKMFERAIRRAALPVSQDGSPFHSRPVLASALALGLGHTSSGEILEMQLTRRVEPNEVRERLAAALPDGVDLFVDGEFPVKSKPGVSVRTRPGLRNLVNRLARHSLAAPHASRDLIMLIDIIRAHSRLGQRRVHRIERLPDHSSVRFRFSTLR